MKAAKLTVIVQSTHEQSVRAALGKAGVGKIGDYENCQFIVRGEAQFYATKDADPAVGENQELTVVDAVSIQTWCGEDQVDAVVKAVKDAHPNEEPAIHVETFDIR